MTIIGYEENFSVCKVEDISGIDFDDRFCFLGKTDEKVSLVCRTEKVPENVTEREDGWKMFRIGGSLDFSLIGILSGIAAVLADNGIGLYAVSTFNTDYILTKAVNFERALSCLENAGYRIERS